MHICFFQFGSDSVELGYYVILDTKKIGIVRWIGNIKNKQHYGIELIDPCGSHNGKSLFSF